MLMFGETEAVEATEVAPFATKVVLSTIGYVK